MREYSNIISLNKNGRGIYCLDTTKGCASGMSNEVNGCYNDCYAAKSAKIYGYDFSKTVLRDFKNEHNRREILNQINKVKLDFIRIGCSGDPSENWEHTISVIKKIDKCEKQIVIITRHWTLLSEDHLKYLNTINVCINTSISAMDKPEILNTCLAEYKRIKPYCKSILRIVSADFNTENETGKMLSEIQHNLFKNEDTLDTVFRPNKNNKLITDGIINVSNSKFLGSKTLVSKFNKKTYLGKCSTCKEMCGIKIDNENYSYPNKRFIPIQTDLFKYKNRTPFDIRLP